MSVTHDAVATFLHLRTPLRSMRHFSQPAESFHFSGGFTWSFDSIVKSCSGLTTRRANAVSVSGVLLSLRFHKVCPPRGSLLTLGIEMNALSSSSYTPIPFSLLCAAFGSFAFAGYYSDLLKPFMPAWLAVCFLILPVTVLIFVQQGEVSDRFLARAHLSAAGLFLLLAVGMEVGSLWGYRPKGLTLYRILAHLAWSFSWASVIKEAYRRRSTK